MITWGVGVYNNTAFQSIKMELETPEDIYAEVTFREENYGGEIVKGETILDLRRSKS